MDPDLKAALDDIRGTMATKDDLRVMATKDELRAIRESMATKDELRAIRESMATKDELRAIRETMATKDELQAIRESMATKDELRALDAKVDAQGRDLGRKMACIRKEMKEGFAGRKEDELLAFREIHRLDERTKGLERRVTLLETGPQPRADSK